VGAIREGNVAREEQKLKLESPLKYLRGAKSNEVLVELKDGSEYTGSWSSATTQ